MSRTNKLPRGSCGVHRAMKPMTAVLDPVMTIIAGAFVGFGAISVILPMNDLLGAIK